MGGGLFSIGGQLGPHLNVAGAKAYLHAKLQTNFSEKKNNKKIQITTVGSKKVKTCFVSKQHTVLLFSHMMQCYRKKYDITVQYNKS